MSCHNLPRALYIESHFLPESFPKIESLPHQATAENQMEEFLNSRAEFEPLGVPPSGGLQPGDLLGLFLPIDNVGRRIRQSCVNHLGVIIGETSVTEERRIGVTETRQHTDTPSLRNSGTPHSLFIHTLMKKNTDIDSFLIPPWFTVIRAAWRPVEVPATDLNR